MVAAAPSAKVVEVTHPPAPLPSGWVLKLSSSQPGCYYYFHMETGISTWQRPTEVDSKEPIEKEPHTTTAAAAAAVVTETEPTRATEQPTALKRTLDNSAATAATDAATPSEEPPAKRSRVRPSKVRVLHILKKHKGSRRPSSWRKPTITITSDQAKQELEDLRAILAEESGDNLKATFEELARTESDCSSAKRGGDLGFFGPKKMQPTFEEASFDLDIGELSPIVESSSGMHIILRIG